MSFIINPFVYPSIDPDCAAFLTATGITNPTISGAVCTLVTSMKANGTWAKMSAIYPMVGGTATTHKFNLKNPADTNAAFRLSFTGGWVHSANGALPNGSNSFANTFFNSSLNASQNSHHISYYSRTNSNLTEVEFGNFLINDGSLIEIRTANVSYFRINNGVATLNFADADSRAFYLANRTASNLINAWRNSTKVIQSTLLLSTPLVNLNHYIGALNNNNVAVFYSTKQCAFATIGSGLTDGEAAALYSSIQTFQTTLGRQI